MKRLNEKDSARVQLDDALRARDMLTSRVSSLELETQELRETIYHLSLRLTDEIGGAPPPTPHFLTTALWAGAATRRCYRSSLSVASVIFKMVLGEVWPQE